MRNRSRGKCLRRISLFKTTGAKLIVLLAFLRIAQYSIGFADFFKLVFCLFVPLIAIWVILQGKFAIGAFDGSIGRPFSTPNNL